MATSAEPLEGLHCTVPTTCKSPYTCLHPSQKNFTTKSIYKFAKFYLAWENSQHFATVVRGVGGGGWGLLTTGFPRKWHLRNECRNSEINFHTNDWCITTQIWVVPLIGCAVWEFSFSSSEVLLRSSSVWNFCACLSDTPWIVLFVFVFKAMSITSTLKFN